nr:helix-turn-helix domain-containing protein [Sphingomonas paucimobilis]
MAGRPHSARTSATAVRLYHENTMPIAKICSMLGISKPTLYAYVRSAETKPVAA